MAALGFQQVVKQNPDDATAKLFLQKSGQLIATGVPQDWDGVEVMSHVDTILVRRRPGA